jgi:hypothetical protein
MATYTVTPGATYTDVPLNGIRRDYHTAKIMGYFNDGTVRILYTFP